MKLLSIFILTLSLSLGAFALDAKKRPKRLMACGTAHGNMIHSLTLNPDQTYVATVALPQYRTQDGTYVKNVPLSNDNVFSSDLDFIEQKNQVLTQLFKDKNFLSFKFSDSECTSFERKGLKAWWCGGAKDLNINGVEIDSVEFSLENQLRSNAVEDEIEIFYADLKIKTKAQKNGVAYVYRSSYTYHPDQERTICEYL